MTQQCRTLNTQCVQERQDEARTTQRRGVRLRGNGRFAEPGKVHAKHSSKGRKPRRQPAIVTNAPRQAMDQDEYWALPFFRISRAPRGQFDELSRRVGRGLRHGTKVDAGRDKVNRAT